ncbi:hypothetical protein ANTQUA_LOCUS5091 [Anthophora quadrimaculata]
MVFLYTRTAFFAPRACTFPRVRQDERSNATAWPANGRHSRPLWPRQTSTTFLENPSACPCLFLPSPLTAQQFSLMLPAASVTPKTSDGRFNLNFQLIRILFYTVKIRVISSLIRYLKL